MDWTGRQVLVTGAGGFIGSHLCERLVELGADVRAFVHYNSAGSWGWLDESIRTPEMRVIAGDVTDALSIRNAMMDCEVVFHLAALIAIPYSYAAPASYVQTNITGTLNVLEAARQLETPRLVHTSTSEVYGTALRVPISEEHPLQGQSPYSATKIAADKLAEAYHRSFDLPVVTVRPFNTFGPRQSARAVIPTIISQARGCGAVRLGSLFPSRDLTFVADTVEGFRLAAETEAAVGRTINIGSGREITIGALAELILELIGNRVRVESECQRHRPPKSEVDRLLADNSLARSLCYWQPAVGLEEGLQRTIDWFETNAGRYRADIYNV